MVVAFLNQPLGKAEQIILSVTFIFKGITLDYESLRLTETSIFKWNGYITDENKINYSCV
jgi:hypothetical protein